MSQEQKQFDDPMRRVIKASPEELKRRLKAQKSAKKRCLPRAKNRASPEP